MKQFRVHSKQRGAALITVLFVVALTVIIAVQMSGRLQLMISRTNNLGDSRQAYWYAIGAEQLAKQMLKKINSEKDSRSNTIHSGQDWAQQGLNYPVDGGSIGGELKDLQSCFNLNALAQDAIPKTANPTPGTGTGKTPTPSPSPGTTPVTPSQARKNGIPFAMEAFQRLLEALEIDEISDVPPEYLAQRLKDWLDQDGQQTGAGGMEEGDYMGYAIPYLAANTLMSSVSELRLVGGFTPAIIAKIKPYVCVIPGDTRLEININTVATDQAEIVMALLKGLAKDDAAALISGREPDGYDKISDMWNKPEMNAVEDEDKQEAIKYFDVTTQYFELKAQTSYGDAKFYLNSKLHLNQSKQVTVIARRFGVDL